MRINTEELHKSKSLVNVKSVDGCSAFKRMIILALFAEQ